MTAFAALFVLTACDGDPFAATDPVDETPVEEDPTGIESDRTLPPGTTSPAPTTGIVRFEPEDGTGNGFAQSFSYDSSNDTFSVDNLAFDGDNTYIRDTQVGQLGPFAVYENRDPIQDPINGQFINQFQHKAIYGVSTSGETEFAIVRTGAYVDYGFGGFVYQRNGDVSLPTTGQALFEGDYAGLRDFQSRGGLEFVDGDMVIAIDFEDFNDGDAVRGEIFNRTIYDTDGNDITGSVITGINAANNASLSQLPTMRFVIEPGVLDDNGEIVGSINSFIVDNTGALVTFEQGNYYAIISGPDATEIVGVVVAESLVSPTVTARETGGFILYR